MKTTKNTKILLSSFALASICQGAVIVNLFQSGDDVIGTFAGTLDLTGSSILSETPGPADTRNLRPFENRFVSVDTTYLFTPAASSPPPQTFGSSFLLSPASSAEGDDFGVNNSVVFFASDYGSGETISGSMTWENTTLNALGLVDTTATWTLVSGDTVEVAIGSFAVPEPHTYGLIVGLISSAVILSKRKRSNHPA